MNAVSNSLWWVNPRLWENSVAGDTVNRPPEYEAIARIERQADNERRPFVLLCVKMEHQLLRDYPQYTLGQRAHHIGVQLGCTIYQIVDALDEASRYLED